MIYSFSTHLIFWFFWPQAKIIFISILAPFQTNLAYFKLFSIIKWNNQFDFNLLKVLQHLFLFLLLVHIFSQEQVSSILRQIETKNERFVVWRMFQAPFHSFQALLLEKPTTPNVLFFCHFLPNLKEKLVNFSFIF